MIKTSYLSLFSVAVLTTDAHHNLTLSEVYGAVKPVHLMQPWHKRSPTRQSRSEKYFTLRDQCDFPLEIYILQDNTASFQDNYAEMKYTQLPLLVEAMSTQHPGTTYGIMSFRDKPIWSLGETRSYDYCQRFESPISADDSLISAVYDRLISTGGGDPSENQLGAIVAASQSSTPGWSNPDAVKLIVLATDAPPHFQDDGLDAYGMAPFSGVFDEANAEAQCLAQYYPTPDQVKDALIAREAYLATIVFDGEWWSGLPSSSWAWFNSYIGQTDDFVEPLGNTATSFFDSLSKVIQSIKDVECAPETTQVPQSHTPAATESIDEKTFASIDASLLPATEPTDEETFASIDASLLPATEPTDEETFASIDASLLPATEPTDEETFASDEEEYTGPTHGIDFSLLPATEPTFEDFDATLFPPTTVKTTTHATVKRSTTPSDWITLDYTIWPITEPPTRMGVDFSLLDASEFIDPGTDHSLLIETPDMVATTSRGSTLRGTTLRGTTLGGTRSSTTTPSDTITLEGTLFPITRPATHVGVDASLLAVTEPSPIIGDTTTLPCVEVPCIQGVVFNVNVGFMPEGIRIQNGGQDIAI